MTIFCKSETDLVPAAVELLRLNPLSRIFAFYGKMGTGKTTFIKALCHQLRVIDVVQSPTFSIINEYKTAQGNSLYHFDFYRITKTEEVFDIGYEEYFYSGDFCFIEWPELIEALLPENTIRVTITGDNERTIEY